jgi:hypothetical protein
VPRGYRPVGKNADPEFRSERARMASAAQRSPQTTIRRIAAFLAEDALPTDVVRDLQQQCAEYVVRRESVSS